MVIWITRNNLLKYRGRRNHLVNPGESHTLCGLNLKRDWTTSTCKFDRNETCDKCCSNIFRYITDITTIEYIPIPEYHLRKYNNELSRM